MVVELGCIWPRPKGLWRSVVPVLLVKASEQESFSPIVGAHKAVRIKHERTRRRLALASISPRFDGAAIVSRDAADEEMFVRQHNLRRGSGPHEVLLWAEVSE